MLWATGVTLGLSRALWISELRPCRDGGDRTGVQGESTGVWERDEAVGEALLKLESRLLPLNIFLFGGP